MAIPDEGRVVKNLAADVDWDTSERNGPARGEHCTDDVVQLPSAGPAVGGPECWAFAAEAEEIPRDAYLMVYLEQIGRQTRVQVYLVLQ